MRLLILIVTMSLIMIQARTETITCNETLRMTSGLHTDVTRDDDGAWITTVVMTIDRDYNEWLNDIIPPCDTPIMVKGIGKSMRIDIARDKARLDAMRNIACIEHEHYSIHRVYERYWESPLYKIKRKLNIGVK